MDVFGWIMVALFILFALFIIVLVVIPYIIIEIKALTYKIHKGVQDKKKDIDKRSEERQHRDEIKRERKKPACTNSNTTRISRFQGSMMNLS